MERRGWVVALLMGLVTALPQLASAGAAAQPERGYATDSLQLPVTSSQAASYDVDVDGRGGRENRLGAFFAALAALGFDLQAAQSEGLASGRTVVLHSLRTKSLAHTRTASWQVLSGVATPEPDFGGAGSFTVDTPAPRSDRLDARIKDHKVRTSLSPGLDLKEANRRPGRDGVKESLSFGFGFSTVRASLLRP